MAGQSTNRLQVSGYRFLARRMAHALVRGDVRMHDDPLRAQSLSLAAGCVLAAITVAVCAILAFLQPSGNVGGAEVVMARESGALYVRIGDTMHPTFNIASARLITGVAGKPELVSTSALNRAKRGPMVGIPGAPDMIGAPLDDTESAWAVCEDADSRTTVMMGRPPAQLDSGKSALVTPRGESAATTYLLYEGRRARVDLRNHAIVRALRLDGVAPRQVSRALLDVLPEAPEITAPAIARDGDSPSVLPGVSVGTVVRLTRAGSTEYYVALAAGVQRVGEAAADLIRFTYPSRRDIASVAQDLIGRAPIVDDLPVTTFPDRGGADESPVLCAQSEAVLVGDSLPSDDDAGVQLAQGDDAGPRVDRFAMPPGRSAFVRATSVSGDSATTGALFFVNDSGVLFGVRDTDAATRLGLTNPVPAPWALLAQLPRGPELSIEAASVGRDSVGPSA
ncbi:type VII secretion protein EccB [Mycolicibacterium tusciae]|uniref:Type VII secretion protein EccB n=1 Tax=Mycolicibacterium tusciae TaxID=75922 RepID=A0A1X0JVA7_9MYCO|nr:type VII secretion protein EccB [Mycolicibacterium tusciae]ORB66879.1 type VII secretion protein EccB [Mycolicibacterium tusciae]